MINFDSRVRRSPGFPLLFTMNCTDKYKWSGDTLFAYPASCANEASIRGLRMPQVIRVFSAYDRSGSNRTAFRVPPPGLMIWVEPGVNRASTPHVR